MAAIDRLPPSTPLPVIASRPQIHGAIVFTSAMARRDCAHGHGLRGCRGHAPDARETWCDPCAARAALAPPVAR